MKILLLLPLLAVPARAGSPTPASRARRLELRGVVREDARRLKQVTSDLHKELLLILAREKSELQAVKAAGSQSETTHAALLEIHERSRRARLALRARGRDERFRLRRAVKAARDEIAALRKKK